MRTSAMASGQRPYHSYLLRLWQAGNGDAPDWRLTLEEVHTRERFGFASAAQLITFLEARMRGPTAGSNELTPAEIANIQQKGGHITQLFSITLTHDKDEQIFERFMLDEIFPAVGKQMRHDDQVASLVLLKANTAERSNEYLWLVHGHDAALQQLEAIKAYGASITPLIDYVERASWFADHQDLDRE
jgi:hypothetical protein